MYYFYDNNKRYRNAKFGGNIVNLMKEDETKEIGKFFYITRTSRTFLVNILNIFPFYSII